MVAGVGAPWCGCGAGAVAGLVATACYAASRLALVVLADLSIRPFDTWRLFGELFLGPAATPRAAFAVGTAYHLANGVGFATAYTLVLGVAGWRAGVAWALVLEALMVTSYPGWLDVRALDEFLTVSVLGHVVYGGVLGWSAQRPVQRDDPPTMAGRS